MFCGGRLLCVSLHWVIAGAVGSSRTVRRRQAISQLGIDPLNHIVTGLRAGQDSSIEAEDSSLEMVILQ